MSELAETIRTRRTELGWSQDRLAQILGTLAGRATLTRTEIRKWESGKHAPGSFWLQHLVIALRLSPQPAPGPAHRFYEQDTEDMHRRDLLVGAFGAAVEAALFRPGPARATTSPLGARLAKAQSLYRDADYTAVRAALPTLLEHAQGAGDQTVLADAYALATELLIKVNLDDLTLVTTERGRVAARAAGDPVRVAEAERCAAMALRHSGRPGTAHLIAQDAATELERGGLAGRAQKIMYGRLIHTAAYSAAIAGDVSLADTYTREADRVMRGFAGQPDTPAGLGQFGPAQHHGYLMSVRCAVGDVGGALKHAQAVDLGQLTSVERQARHWNDLARIYDLAGKPERARFALGRVFAVAPQEVTGRPRVVQLARRVGFQA